MNKLQAFEPFFKENLKEAKTFDLTDRIIAYESGELSDTEIIDFFQDLIDSGLVWELQGHYQRMTRDLIKAGLIDP